MGGEGRSPTGCDMLPTIDALNAQRKGDRPMEELGSNRIPPIVAAVIMGSLLPPKIPIHPHFDIKRQRF
jgi:hypothetical protein